MIYTSPIDSINWSAVEEFCGQGIAEGSFLDYKATFPNDLARTIAAMANTLGGAIIIGAEDLDGKPKMPLTGIAMESGISERVTNIVLSNLTPPVFPEVAVCPDDSGKKAVVLIRIAQSPDAPHAIQNNTRVYLRTGNRNNPEQLATLDQVDWLNGKRRRSVLLREQISADALRRSSISFSRTLKKDGSEKAGLPPASLMLAVGPTFPGAQFATPPELRMMFRDIQVRDYYGTDAMFPIGGSNATLLQDGAYVDAAMDGDSGSRAYYTELSVFGQVSYRQTLASKHQNRVLIRASEIFCRFDEFMATAKKFFDKIGYRGYVTLKCALHGANRVHLGHWHPNESGMETSECPDESVEFDRSFLVSDWDGEGASSSVAAITKIGWAYDWDIPDGLVARYYKQNRGAIHYR